MLRRASACEFFFLLRKVSQTKIGYTFESFANRFPTVKRFEKNLDANGMTVDFGIGGTIPRPLETRFKRCVLMNKRVLGLDLGPNSIGWALVNDDLDAPQNSSIIDMGVRVFPEGVDAFDTSKEKSRNEQRRVARGMRRQTRRRRQRHRALQQGLIDAGLWPREASEATDLLQTDPYLLRAKALEERMEPFELGRIILHLCKRRGFLSNRKKDRGDSEVKGMLAEIQENKNQIASGGHVTIGQWLNQKNKERSHINPTDNGHTRKRHLARQQYLDEFEAIWQVQSAFHPELLTDSLKYGKHGKQAYPAKPRDRRKGSTLLTEYGIFGLLYFQRPMYWPKSVIGLCELEPKQKRCPVADRRYQRFRLLQEVNNLRFINPDTHGEESLETWQREKLLNELSRRDAMTFDQIRKSLNFLETVKFNLERGSRSKLKGAPIDALFAAKKILGKQWHDRAETEKTLIIEQLLEHERDENAFIDAAVNKWNMTAEQADAILGIDLPAGYGSLSKMALEKLLPHMESGLKYMGNDESDSAMHAAGYFRRDQLHRRVFDKLPDPRRTKDSPIGDLPNPVVKRALTEVRRVVNAIIRRYGKPDAIHVEMAREVQQSKERRDEYSKRIREREAVRTEIAEELRKNNIRPTRDAILKYQLWRDQGMQCIYSGEQISFSQLFSESGGTEVDHILPRSRTLDDSQPNKVLCYRRHNADKGDKTPFEWLASSDKERYEQICQRAGILMRSGKMSYSKYKRFTLKDLVLDDFIARQLVDTSYITKATAEYLRCLFEQDHEVLGLKGQLTAELRWHWGLETILSELPDSPAWVEQKKLRSGEKNRADHRHHAIDAVVVALTNRSRLQKLSALVRRGGTKKHGEVMFDPWDGFRNDVLERIQAICVSHRVERKVRGKLHEETNYGPTPDQGEWVVRKPLSSLTANEIDKIRDQAIRTIVIDRLAAHGIKIGRGKKPDAKLMKELLSDCRMPSGVPIKKVRIVKPDLTIRKLRPDNHEDQTFVKPGSTHHLCLFEWEEEGKMKRDVVFVTMLEAAQRLKNHEPVIQRYHPTNNHARFLFSLSSREMVLANFKGEEKLLTFKTAASTQGQIYFAEHTDARKSADYKKYVAKANTLDARKVTVDPLGQVRWAND